MVANIVKSIIVSLSIIAAVLLYSFSSNAADEVYVPKDELAQESVYPVFDNPISVKNRNIKDSETFDFGLFGGFAITEPIAQSSKFGFELNYHFNEANSLGFRFSKNSNGLSKDAEALKNDFDLNFNRAPYPEYNALLDYNYKMFYGKLSITKNSVINTSFYTSLSGGAIKYVHKTYPMIGAGLGERFYLTNHLSFKVDLRLFIFNGPSPFKAGSLRSTDPVPDYNDFEEKLTFINNLELGLNYLF